MRLAHANPGRTPARYRARGFTLVELLIVVLIIAITAALAVPRMGSAATTKLTSAARLLIADLGYAQVESITHSDDPRVVVFDLVNHRYHVAAASSPDTPITHPVTKGGYVVTFGDGVNRSLAGVTIHAATVGDDLRLGFGRYGQLDQPGIAVITLRCEQQQITIQLDPINSEASVSGPTAIPD